ncbi:hypothetical protein [Oerskovia jenensis]|uniref:hypothetical protein n=1 Tax=Oerskovia jenensis TaxID=162169 RepID=UPI0036DD0387
MSSTDVLRPRPYRPAARPLRVGAVALAVTAMLPLAAQTAHAEPAPGEPTCQDVGADQLGRDGVGRVAVGDTGLVLVRNVSAVSVEGDAATARSITVIRGDGVEQPGWDAGSGPRNELNVPTYDHVRVCWDEPVTDQVVVPETTPTTVPWTNLEEPTTVPWTDLEEPTTTPWTQVAERPVTTTTATVPTKRSTAATDTKWSTILKPTDGPSTPVDRKRSTPTTTQESTTPAATLARPEVPKGVAETADSTPATVATAQPPVAAQARTANQAEAPTERLVQTGAAAMPLVVASTSLVVLGGVLVHLSRPSRRPAARRRSAR